MSFELTTTDLAHCIQNVGHLLEKKVEEADISEEGESMCVYEIDVCVSPDLLYNVTSGNTAAEDIKDFMNLKGLL